MRRLLTGLLLASVAGACATRGDVEELRLDHERIRSRQDDHDRQLTVIQESIARLEQLLQNMRADFNADLTAMREQVAAMESALRGTESRIEQLRRYRPQLPSADVVVPDSAAADDAGVDQVSLYNAAITDYQQGRLDLAKEGFAEYIARFPQGLSASDAQYWLGIVDYDEVRYEDAVAALTAVVRRYPDSAKAPLALRKIGDAHRALGDLPRARASYQALIDGYPNSAEADAARRELAELR